MSHIMGDLGTACHTHLLSERVRRRPGLMSHIRGDLGTACHTHLLSEHVRRGLGSCHTS